MNSQYNISFTKNFGHNQICIEPIHIDDSQSSSLHTSDYRTKMICNNSINGLLKTHVQYINGCPNFLYDISGLQSLSITLENKPLDYATLTHIIYEIYNLIFTCEKYMLDTDKLLLEPEYIFLAPNNSTISLCYLPFNNSDFTSSMRKLFDYFLKHIDHTDEKCVYVAYSIHNHCVSNNITPNILVSYINTNDTQVSTISHTNIIDNPDKTFLTNPLKPPQSKTSTISLEEHYTQNIEQNIMYNLQQQDSPINNLHPTIITKFGILAIGFFIGLGCILSLYFFKLIDLPILTIFILILLGTCLIIGYNIYKSLEGPIQTIEKNNTKNNEKKNNITNFYIEDSGSTILLSSSENNDSHMLIYTGSDMNSQVNISHYPFTIGKTNSCDLVLQNPIISRLHCRINCYIDDNNLTVYYLEDLNSTNGTYINGTPTTPYKKYSLKSGDNISFGHLTYIFR